MTGASYRRKPGAAQPLSVVNGTKNPRYGQTIATHA